MKVLDLTGKNALVTGATGELGRAICRGLAECGANVAVCYHSQKEVAERLCRELEENYGVQAFPAQADVSDPESVQRMKEEVGRGLGTVDILVNNAVAFHKWQTVLDQDIAAYESQFRSSVLQAVLMAKAFVPDMIQKKTGAHHCHQHRVLHVDAAETVCICCGQAGNGWRIQGAGQGSGHARYHCQRGSSGLDAQ